MPKHIFIQKQKTEKLNVRTNITITHIFGVVNNIPENSKWCLYPQKWCYLERFTVSVILE